MPLESLYFLEVVILGCWFHWGFVHYTLCPACALTFRMAFSSFSVTVYMPQRALKSGFPSRPLQKFAVLLRATHTQSFPPLQPMCIWQGSYCQWALYILLALHKLLLGIYSRWHEIQISVTLASVSSISEILVLGRPPSWCILKFTACFDVSHSTAHTRGQEANFTNTTFAKRELVMNTLHKVMSIKTTLSNTSFVQITKSNQGLA
jgi:hypothetical protein